MKSMHKYGLRLNGMILEKFDTPTEAYNAAKFAYEETGIFHESCWYMLKDYKPLKLPDGMSEGLLFSMASSKQLDIFGKRLKLKRRQFLFVKEPDFLFKIRIRNKQIRATSKKE